MSVKTYIDPTTGKKRYYCSICWHEVGRLGNIARHMRQAHTIRLSGGL